MPKAGDHRQPPARRFSSWHNGRNRCTMVLIAAIPDAVGKPVEGALEPEPSVPQQGDPEATLPGTMPTLPAPGERGEQDLCAPDMAQWELPSWEDIVRAHSARVYRLAFRLTGNQHDAEDLTQEVFVRVFRSLATYTPGTFEGWLHRITTNLFLDMARRRQRIRFEGLGDDAAQRLHGPGPTPAEAFEERHLDADVYAALQALP